MLLALVLLVSGCANNGASGRLPTEVCGPGDGATRYTDAQIELMSDEDVNEALTKNEIALARGCAVANK
jgi:hypothetical protein